MSSHNQAVAAEVPGATAVQSPELPPVELSGELLYQILEAEMAIQRKHFDIATARYLDLAQQTRDPRIAERAARVAIYARDDARALSASRLWLELDPDNSLARQMAVFADIRTGDLDDALKNVGFLITAHADDPEQGFGLFASLLSRQQDAELAFDVLQRYIQAHGESAAALFTSAQLAVRAGKPQAADDATARVLELRPDWVEAIALRVQVMLQLGRSKEATDFLAAKVKQYPDDTGLRVAYGRLLMEESRLADAIPQYEVLTERMPDNSDILMTLALLHLQLNGLDEAEKYLQQVAKLGDRPDEVEFYLGWVEEKRGHAPAAIGHYEAVGAGKSFAESRIRISLLLAGQGNLNEARELLHALRGQEPSYSKRLYQVEGELLRQAGQYEEALKLFDEAVAEMPDDLDMLYLRALLAEDANQFDVTERDLRAILARDPDNVNALNALGYTLADRTNRYQEAYELIKRALALEPDNNAILDSMGWVLYRLGDYQGAVQNLKRSLEIKEDHEVAAHLGEVLWVSGAQEQARDVWEQALEHFPDDKVLLDVMKRFGQ